MRVDSRTREDPRHRRSRIHRLALRPHCCWACPAATPTACRRRPPVTVLDKLTYSGNLANLDPGRATTRGCASSQGDICDAGAGRRARAPGTTRSCTSPPSRTSTGPSPGAAPFVTTNVLGTQTLLDAALRARHRPVRARLHRRGVRLDRRGLLDRGPGRSRPTRRTRPSRPAPTCSRWPTTAPTAWTWWSPAAPTTTGRTSSRRRSSRCSSPTCSTAARCRSTATAATSATGCTSHDHCRGHPAGPGEGPRRRGLPHRRRHRADQQGADRAAAGGLRRRLGPGRARSPTARATTAATRWTSARSATSSGTPRASTFDDGLAADRRLVPGQPRLVGAAEGARRPLMTRWLVTGAGGMLGRDLLAGAARRRDLEVTAADPRRPGHHRPRRGRATPSPGTTWWSTRRPGPTWTAPRRDEAGGHRGQRRRRSANLAARLRRDRRAADARLHRLRLPRRRRHRRTRRTRRPRRSTPTAAASSSASRPCSRLLPEHRLRGAHRLALRRARPQLRRHHAAAGRRARAPRRGRRPARPAHLVVRAGRAARRARPPRRWPGTPRPGSTTAPRRARPPGTAWPGPCSPRPDSTRTGSARPPATGSRARPRRPAYSVLGHDRWAAAGLPPLPDWRDALADALPTPPLAPAPWKVA